MAIVIPETSEKIRLEEARLRHGLTVEELAYRSGIATRTLFRLKEGDRPHVATRPGAFHLFEDG